MNKIKMFVTVRGFLLLGFLSLVTIGVSAQALTLEEARLYALANSRSLARFNMAIQSSILDERNQLYNVLPSISANYRASMRFFRDWEFINPFENISAGVSISITQVIFQGGRYFIQRAISEITTESIRKDALAEYFNVLYSVDNAYYAVLEAAAALEAEEASLVSAVLGLSIAHIRHESGMINRGDYLRAFADKETRENARNQARRNLTMRMNSFRAITGITGPLELEQINFDVYEEVITRLSGLSDEEAENLFEQFWVILTAANPAIARASLNNQRAERNLSLALNDYSPALSASIFATDITYSSANGFGITGESGITIRGTIPLDFWVMNNRIERSRIARDSTMLDFASLNSSLEQELRTVLLNLCTQSGTVLSSRRSLEYSELRHEYALERFRLSQGSLSDLNDANTLLITSRNNIIRASYGFLQNLSRLRSLCALGNEERLIGILLGN
jgi:outer membrane protein TolC